MGALDPLKHGELPFSDIAGGYNSTPVFGYVLTGTDIVIDAPDLLDGPE